MKLEYRLNDSLNERTVDLSSMDRGEILWHCFPGDVSIRGDVGAIETKFGWVPLAHFALAMARIYRELMSGESESSHYTFTESDDLLVFDVVNSGVIRIRATFDHQEAVCAPAQMNVAVVGFIRALRADLDGRFPGFRENSVSAELSSVAASLEEMSRG